MAGLSLQALTILPDPDSELQTLLGQGPALAPDSAARLPRGRLPLRITADWQWLYQGSPIERPGLLQLLASALLFIDGRYFLQAPEQLLAIDVDDTPFSIVDFEFETNTGELVLVSDRGHQVAPGEHYPLRLLALPGNSQSTPCIDLGAGLLARISRGCYYRLVELAGEGSHAQRPALLLDANGVRHLLGYLD